MSDYVSVVQDGKTSDTKIIADEENIEKTEEIDESASSLERLKILSETAAPVVLTFFLSILGNFVQLIFAGHLQISPSGNEKQSPTPAQIFAAISLANMFANVTYKSIIIGLSGSIETLGSQHNGAKNYREVGLTLNRALLILSITCIPCYLTWHYSGEFFTLMKIEPEVCLVIKDYLTIRAWEMPFGVLQISFEKFLMSLGVMHPPMYGEAHFNLSLLTLNILFRYGGFGFGYKGLGYAWVLSVIAGFGTTLAMAIHHPHVQRCLQPFVLSTILDVPKLWEFISLGLPGMLMLLSEWWAFEILSIFAGLLGTPEVAAQTIILQTAALAYMVPLGIGIATASLVGNALGANKRQLAIEIAELAFKVVVTIELFLGLIIWLFGGYFVQLFTDETDVLIISKSVMGFLSFFVLADGCNAVASGVLRGTGKQNVGAVTNVISYYCFGLPLAWLLCFNANWGVAGLMMGLSLGTLTQVVSLSSMVFFFQNYIFTSALKLETSEIPVANNQPKEGKSAGGGSSIGGSFVIEELGDDDDDWVDK